MEMSTDIITNYTSIPNPDTVYVPTIIDNIVYYSVSIISPIILFPGLIGNVLILLVLRRKELGTMPSAPYLATLAVADSGGLIFGLCEMWMWYSFDISLRSNSAMCKIMPYMIYFSIMLSSWCIVAVSVDRFICIKFPFKARNITFKHRVFIIACIILCLLTINIHLPLMTLYDPAIDFCDSNPGEGGSYHYFESYIFPWLDFTVTFAIPFSVILLCNIGMISVLTTTKKLTELDDATRKEDEASRKLTRLLILLSVTFIITTSPVTMVLIYDNLNTPYDVNEYPVLSLLLVFTQFLAYANNAINFLLYCAAGDKFREALKALVMCK